MSAQPVAKVSLALSLYESAKEVPKLVEFINAVRGPKNDLSGKHSIKQTDLDNLFSKSVWKEATKGGHRKLTHEVTGIVVEYANHSKGIDPGAAQTIFGQVQKHVNILHNDVFGLNKRGWPEDPKELDFDAALRRLNPANSSSRSRSSSAP